MKLGRSGLILWGLYVVFAGFAIMTNLDERPFQFGGPLGFVKALVWLSLLAFLAYSVRCTLRENFFKSVRSVASLYWGRQIGIDLYLGLCIGLLIIFLNDGLLIALLWLVPVLVYANLIVLLYLAVHFDRIVMPFVGG